ncbi:hypothetical protein CB1_000465014 [Camelus ferus]|nr:hypothetical protein CB1_000465014 [Camelus ferus]
MMYKGQGKGCGDTEERGGHVSQAVRSRCVLLAENQAGVPDTHACILASSSCIIGCPGPACPHTYRTASIRHHTVHTRLTSSPHRPRDTGAELGESDVLKDELQLYGGAPGEVVPSGESDEFFHFILLCFAIGALLVCYHYYTDWFMSLGVGLLTFASLETVGIYFGLGEAPAQGLWEGGGWTGYRGPSRDQKATA